MRQGHPYTGVAVKPSLRRPSQGHTVLDLPWLSDLSVVAVMTHEKGTFWQLASDQRSQKTGRDQRPSCKKSERDCPVGHQSPSLQPGGQGGALTVTDQRRRRKQRPPSPREAGCRSTRPRGHTELGRADSVAREAWPFLPDDTR